MRIQYTGATPIVETRTGLWEPGQERDVEDEWAEVLLIAPYFSRVDFSIFDPIEGQ